MIALVSTPPNAPSHPDDADVRVLGRGEVGVLEWRSGPAPGRLAEAIARVTDDALSAGQVRRVEASVPEWDHLAIRALHRAGFRREGRLRGAWRNDDATHSDLLLYARLAGDPTEGAHRFTAVMDSVLPTKRVIGHVVFTDALGHVLLAETTYKDDWELPGGIVEPGETPARGAEREVMEELGIAVALSTPALIDWMPPSLGWSDAIEFIYHGGVLARPALPDLPESEIRALHWVESSAVEHRVTPLSARRISLVLGWAARGDVGILITENGYLRR